MTLNADDRPLDVEVQNGEVVMTGPRVAVALRPDAATETAKRLVAAANRARAEALTAAEHHLAEPPASNDI